MMTAKTTCSNDTQQLILDTAQQIMSHKGFSAVGLNEILSTAGVPKGSFYHYFASKEAFGVALLDAYFADYMAHLDGMLKHEGMSAAQRLMAYWDRWLETQASNDFDGKCLAVKLGAEVSDLSEPMRTALMQGTSMIIERLAQCIEEGVADGSLAVESDARHTAQMLYQMWLGAGILGKITRNRNPFTVAIATTRRILHFKVNE